MHDKGRRRRASVVQAAADLLRQEGPAGLTHRAVAAHAGCSLSATTYYFASRGELAAAAGAEVARRWAEQAEEVAAREATGDAARIEAAVEALLPPADQVRGHYEHLAGAGHSPEVAAAYARGRPRVDAAMSRIVGPLGLPAALAVAIIDGAAVSALSEGRDPVVLARDLLAKALAQAECSTR
ncbi:TetR family transcriptional regulator [Ruania suaedae]|uniref:TetR/AcrR family transcriptional regulator n=1 Tax=Ruania suaedae TaxID=2897774 RepID=UPI001E3C1DA3|nr:TetR family transcriptional regulator [Ruania suaedae]UFU02487.1 TetR family transcriptional regulator [Ruania suaedae]